MRSTPDAIKFLTKVRAAGRGVRLQARAAEQERARLHLIRQRRLAKAA